ncbi:MAG: response regulator, partial [Coriobacteriia bacterium]|nr:response regulator [Coriobacteriia bacterium]
KSQFLATMSHEMRTPLNAVLGMASIGKSAADMDRMAYCFNKIEDASQHLLGVINDILDMSKIEAEKFELSLAEFNFERMLQRVVSVVNHRVEEKRQHFVVHIDEAIPNSLIGDDQRLAQVITNLLGNAVKFTPEAGSIVLDAFLEDEQDDICTILIKVTDTGIGISAEQQAGLFRSFQQAESDTSRKYGGTGLGLVISKNIVELMNGRMQVTSELGKGSSFSFTVQMTRGKELPHTLSDCGVDWNDVRVLAVDDDPDILEFFAHTIAGFGLSCDTATSGEEALALAKRNGAYTFYFVEWKMPGISGLEFSKALQAQGHSAASFVVILSSAVDWIAIEEEAKEAGVYKIITKPLFPSPIMDTINECLGMSHKALLNTESDCDGIFAGHRILLAEDVEINREIVLALLEHTGIEIDCAENGAEAVRMFYEGRETYEMIFMDVQMPETDGYEATRRIRTLGVPESTTIPIIAMTANVFREDVEKCLAAGMNGHIGKPLKLDEVLHYLRLHLCV